MKSLHLLQFGILCASLATASQPQTLSKRDTVSDILTDIEDAVECAACETLLVVLQALAHLGNDAFDDVIIDVCVDLGIEDEDVCEGSIEREGPILAHDLRNMVIPSHTAQLFCSTIFGLCQIPDTRSYTVDFPTTKPDNATRPASSGQTPIQVVHYSDIHVDLEYEVGASYNCTKNICCRPYTSADAPGNNSFPAGPYGNVNCDSPLSLEESMYNAINTLVPNASFSIFTGDVVEGAVWLVTDDEIVKDLDSAYTHMSSNLSTTVYGVIGNHDAAPVNSFPTSDIDTTISSQYVYDTLSENWSQWIGSTAAAEADSYGAYSVKYPGGNLRIISFNSNFYYKENFWLYEETMQYDPDGQLAWLVSELSAAESAGERVWLMGHMPMGASDAFYDGSNYFDQIVQRYDATISAMFFGHTHKDEFEISYSDYDNRSASTATMNSYIAPALTPTSGNPTFRVYSVEPVTFGILDYTVYIANISSSTYQSDPVWYKYYSVKETYGPLLSPPIYANQTSVELTPAFWHNLTVLFEDDDSVFQDYYARKTRGYDPTTCTDSDDDCKTDEICQLRAARSEDNCVTVTPGVSFKHKNKRETQHKRLPPAPGHSAAEMHWERDVTSASMHGDDCQGSVMARMFLEGGFSKGVGLLKNALSSSQNTTLSQGFYLQTNVSAVNSTSS